MFCSDKSCGIPHFSQLTVKKCNSELLVNSEISDKSNFHSKIRIGNIISYSINIYSVTKNLHKICVITFKENYGESRERVKDSWLYLDKN